MSSQFRYFLLSLSCLAFFSQGIAEEDQEVYNYPRPGLVVFRNGRWIGSDYLYNLSNQIPIFVEIIKPADATIPFTEEMVRDRFVEIFRKANINPEAKPQKGVSSVKRPTLPFFHVFIMIQPLKKGYVALCQGQLFEKVDLDRVNLDSQTTIQAITWEDKNLIVSPEESFLSKLKQNLDQIGTAFTDRFRFYEGIKTRIKQSP